VFQQIRLKRAPAATVQSSAHPCRSRGPGMPHKVSPARPKTAVGVQRGRTPPPRDPSRRPRHWLVADRDEIEKQYRVRSALSQSKLHPSIAHDHSSWSQSCGHAGTICQKPKASNGCRLTGPLQSFWWYPLEACGPGPYKRVGRVCSSIGIARRFHTEKAGHRGGTMGPRGVRSVPGRHTGFAIMTQWPRSQASEKTFNSGS